MKKTILIILGILIILLGIGAWVYFIMYGAPKSPGEIFARFQSEDSEVPEPVSTQEPSTIDVSDTTPAGTPQRLKQLTTKSVAGAVFTGNGIRYVETGTGHIYDIGLGGGEETLISGTTIPMAREAVFSHDGSYVAISFIDGSRTTIVGEVRATESGEGGLEGITLPTNAREVAFTNATGTLTYLLKGDRGSSGYLFNVEKETSTEIFSIPLRDVEVVWGDTTYVYTTPAGTQAGFIYRVTDDTLTPIGSGGTALTAFRAGETIIVSTLTDKKLASYAYTLDGSEKTPLVLGLIPEKCAGAGNVVYCAIPYTSSWSSEYPDAWYKGVASFVDNLWSVGMTSATPLADISAEASRDIDVKEIGVNPEGNRLYFINKNDGSLWMYDMTI